MSTNYYWIYEEPKPQFILLPTGERIQCLDADVPYLGTHVGKRYGFGSIAQQAHTAFIFAAEPMTVLKTIDHKITYRPDEKIIEDEYGRELTAKEFSVLLYDCLQWEIQSIGESFC